jgi:hypothetical protein
MSRPVTEANLNMHYQSSRIEDTLVCILEVLSLLVQGKGDDTQKYTTFASGFQLVDGPEVAEAIPGECVKEYN